MIKTHRFNSTIPSPAVYPANAGNAGYQYDQNGNTIQKNNGCLPGACRGQIVNYIYNADNRLIEVKDGSNNTVAIYTYDPYGRRIKKQTGVGGQPIPSPPAGEGIGEGVITTYYLYSDEGLIGEYDQSGNEIKTYGYRSNSTWSTDPLFMKQRTDYYFYHNDHPGWLVRSRPPPKAHAPPIRKYAAADLQLQTHTDTICGDPEYSLVPFRVWDEYIYPDTLKGTSGHKQS